MKKKDDNPKAFKSSKNLGGRPIKLTDEIIEKIKAELLLGNWIETAVVCAGVPKSTYYKWRKTAARTKPKPPPVYQRLVDAVEEAQAIAERNDVARMLRHSGKNHKATAWRLERRFPDRWGRKEIQKVIDGATGGNQKTFRLNYDVDDFEEEESDD